MRPCAVSKPPQSVHGSPGASSEVHWFHPSLAHNWRTTATLAVLSKTTSSHRRMGRQGGRNQNAEAR
jgi:hypothetical protein